MRSEPENPNRQICTVIYQENEPYGSEPAPGTALLIAKWDQSSGLSLFFNPRWRDFVAHKHREYVEDLLADLTERLRFEPEALFHELCSLDVVLC